MIPLPPLVVRGAVAAILAVAINAYLLIVGRGLLLVPWGFEPLQWQSVLLTSAAAAVGGTVTYWLLDRLTERTDRAFLVVAALVLLGSFVPLVTEFLRRFSAIVVGFVAMLHVSVAVVTVGVLVVWSSNERTRG